MILVHKLIKIVSATDDALTYRVRRIFYICVCVCVYVIRLWKCVVSIIISHTKNITDVINNSIINNTTKFIIYMHSFVIIHNNLDTRIFIANQQWPPTVVSRFQIKRYVKLECETSITNSGIGGVMRENRGESVLVCLFCYIFFKYRIR